MIRAAVEREFQNSRDLAVALAQSALADDGAAMGELLRELASDPARDKHVRNLAATLAALCELSARQAGAAFPLAEADMAELDRSDLADIGIANAVIAERAIVILIAPELLARACLTLACMLAQICQKANPDDPADACRELLTVQIPVRAWRPAP